MTQDSLFEQPAGTRLDELVIYCDGGSRGNPGPSAIGAVVLDPSTDPPRRLAIVSERIGVTTNNVAEYRALIAGLEAAAPFGAQPDAHTLLAAPLVRVGRMLGPAGPGRRPRRRRALGLGIGWFSGLVLGGAWADKEVFWWPAFGVTRPDAPLFGAWPVVAIE